MKRILHKYQYKHQLSLYLLSNLLSITVVESHIPNNYLHFYFLNKLIIFLFIFITIYIYNVIPASNSFKIIFKLLLLKKNVTLACHGF